MNDNDYLEEEFQSLLKSTFETLRSHYDCRRYSKEEAEKLQRMLERKLGMEDPDGEIPEEAWRRSNWCSE